MASINHTGHKFPPLFCAVKKNDRGAVEALLKYNPPIKLTEIGGRCGVLHIAAEHTSSAMVRLLLNHNAKVDINFIDSECDTPLDIAAMNSKPDIVQLLLQNNANVDGEESEGEEGEAPEREKTEQNPKYTPLHCAAEAGNVPIIKALLDHGASISRPDEITESTPLHYAAQAGNRDAVFYLVGNGADVNAVDNDKNTPLHRAAMSGNPAVIKDLINSQADIRSKGEADFNLLHYVARHVKDPEMIKFIIENNPAAINEKNEIGEIPLDCAHERGNLVAIQVLSEYSEYNATTSVPNKEKYVLLQEAAESGHENVVRFLIETGVAGGSKVQDDPDAIAYNRMLLENKLANLGDNHLPLEVARFLIETGVERGSDVNQDPAALAYNRMLLENNLINLAEGDLPSEDKGSPLEWAVYQGNLAVVRSLIEQNPTLSNNDKNRLMRLAIWARHDSKDRLPIISLLLEKWGGIEAFLRHDDLPLEDERTPLGLAAYRGQLGVVRSLMEKKPIIPDKNRLMRLAIWTRPYSNSNSNDRLQIVSLLLEKLGGIEALDQDTQEAIKAYYRRPTALVLL